MYWNNKIVREEMEMLTIDLVNIRSENDTNGEVEIAAKIEAVLRETTYFKNHPELVWTKM